MKVLAYVLVPVLIVSAYAVYRWLSDRQPSSLEHGVDSFRREMDALSPDARIGVRRRPGAEGAAPAGAPEAGGSSGPVVIPGPSTPPGARRSVDDEPVG